MRFDRRPLASNDAVDAGVSQRTLFHQTMTPEHAIELGPKPLDRLAALMIEEAGTELNGDAVESLECMREHQQFTFGVQSRALYSLAVPRRPDFEASMLGLDVHVGGHTHRSARCCLENSERQHGSLALQRQSALDFRFHLLWRGDPGVPQLPQLAVASCFLQVRKVLVPQWLEGRVLPAQNDRFRPTHL